jgi:uncharacterized protein YhjY with autotransporter beta-barrel domain
VCSRGIEEYNKTVGLRTRGAGASWRRWKKKKLRRPYQKETQVLSAGINQSTATNINGNTYTYSIYGMVE